MLLYYALLMRRDDPGIVAAIAQYQEESPVQNSFVGLFEFSTCSQVYANVVVDFGTHHRRITF